MYSTQIALLLRLYFDETLLNKMKHTYEKKPISSSN